MRLGYARISHGGITDTEMQVGRFIIPSDPVRQWDMGRVVGMESMCG